MKGRVEIGVAALAVAALVGSACNGAGRNDPAVSPSASPSDALGTIRIAPGEPIRLGTLLATSGSASDLGTDSLRGVQLAVDYLDGTFDGQPGTLAGHPIELMNLDEECSASGGREGARVLAADRQIVGVVGTTCSVAALGADRVFSDAGVLLISPSASSPLLTEPATHQPFFLRVAYDDRLQGAVVADYAYEKLQARTAAATYPDEPYASATPSGFRDRFERDGGRVSASVAVPQDPEDARRLLAALGSGGPDLLYASSVGSPCADVLSLFGRTPGMENASFVGTDGCMATSFMRATTAPAFVAGPDLSRIVQGEFYRTDFLPAYETRYGTAPISATHAFAFDAATMLFDALEITATAADDGTLTIGRTALREAAYATEGYQGLSGSLSCTPDGECAGSAAVGVFQAPEVPIEGGDMSAEPVYAETLSLSDLEP